MGWQKETMDDQNGNGRFQHKYGHFEADSENLRGSNSSVDSRLVNFQMNLFTTQHAQDYNSIRNMTTNIVNYVIAIGYAKLRIQSIQGIIFF